MARSLMPSTSIDKSPDPLRSGLGDRTGVRSWMDPSPGSTELASNRTDTGRDRLRVSVRPRHMVHDKLDTRGNEFLNRPKTPTGSGVPAPA